VLGTFPEAFPKGHFPAGYNRGRVLGQTWEVAAWEICTFGKLPLGKIPLGSCHSGKILWEST